MLIVRKSHPWILCSLLFLNSNNIGDSCAFEELKRNGSTPTIHSSVKVQAILSHHSSGVLVSKPFSAMLFTLHMPLGFSDYQKCTMGFTVKIVAYHLLCLAKQNVIVLQGLPSLQAAASEVGQGSSECCGARPSVLFYWCTHDREGGMVGLVYLVIPIYCSSNNIWFWPSLSMQIWKDPVLITVY